VQPRTVEQRLTMLEQQMEELKELPVRVERVESQILQLRTEMKDECSAIRGEMRDLRKELRDDIRIGVEGSQNLATGLHAEAMRAIAAVDAAIRRDVVSRLDRLLELQRPGDDPT
jgi:hypothetical protein